MLVAVDDIMCEYRFEWSTAVVCKSSPLTPDTGCKFDDKEANVSFDLSVLSSNNNDMQVCCVLVIFHLCFRNFHRRFTVTE